MRQPPTLASAAAHAQSSTQVLAVVSRQKQLQPTGFHSFCRDGSVSCSSPVQPHWTGTPCQVHHAGNDFQHGRCQPPTMWEAVSLPRFRAAAASLQFPFLGAASLNSRSHPCLPTSASLTTRSGPYRPKHASPGASRSFSGLVAGCLSHSGSTLLRQVHSLHDWAQAVDRSSLYAGCERLGDADQGSLRRDLTHHRSCQLHARRTHDRRPGVEVVLLA